jgi:hypothetical protein
MTDQQETGGERELIRIEAGPYTEELKNFIFRDLPRDAASRIDWRPERSYAPGLAREPVTTAITFFTNVNLFEANATATIAVAAIISITGIIKHWMNLNAARMRESDTINLALKHPELQKYLFDELGNFEKVLIENEDKPTPPKE